MTIASNGPKATAKRNPDNLERREEIQHTRDALVFAQVNAKLAYVEGRHPSEPADVALVMIMQTRKGDMMRCPLTALEATRLIGMLAGELGHRLVTQPRSIEK